MHRITQSAVWLRLENRYSGCDVGEGKTWGGKSSRKLLVWCWWEQYSDMPWIIVTNASWLTTVCLLNSTTTLQLFPFLNMKLQRLKSWVSFLDATKWQNQGAHHHPFDLIFLFSWLCKNGKSRSTLWFLVLLTEWIVVTFVERTQCLEKDCGKEFLSVHID